MKKLTIPTYEEAVAWFNDLRVVKRVLHWAKTNSMPGFSRVPIYDIVVFVLNEMRRFDLFTRANSVAFSFFMSLFPSLLTLFTLFPYLQRYFLQYLPENEGFNTFIYNEIQKVMPGVAGEQVFSFVEQVTEPSIGALSSSFLVAIYFSSNGMLALMQGFEKSYATTFKTRGEIKKRFIAIGLTFLLGLMLIAAFIFIVLGQVILRWLSEYITLAGFSTTSIEMLRWVAILMLFYFGIAVLYRYGAATYRRFRIFSPGTTLATFLAIGLSTAFSVYINEFDRYDSYYLKFYGSIATIVIIMLWIQLNALILLIGFELNAAIAVNRDLKTVKDAAEAAAEEQRRAELVELIERIEATESSDVKGASEK